MENTQLIIDYIRRVVEVNSVYDSNTVSEKTPYGAGVSKAFKELETISNELGLHLEIYDNRVAEIVVGNKNATNSIGILAHIDVVPVDRSWNEGFKLVSSNGRIFGRGVADDKGPLIINLVALSNYYKDNKEFLDKSNINIKLVVGGDEERGSSCADYYFKTLKKPSFTCGYTPDGEFPVVYGEKGMLGICIKGRFESDLLLSATTENATNVVPSEVALNFKFDRDLADKLKASKYVNTIENIDSDTLLVKVVGKSAHASLSELGDNAIVKALHLLKGLGIMILPNFDEVFKNAKGLEVDPNEDPVTELGGLTANLGSFVYHDGLVEFFMDVRYNEKTDTGAFLDYLSASFDPLKVVYERHDKPLLISKNSRFIEVLMKTYKEATGDVNAFPVTKGGGTYAKHAENVVAFGPEFAGISNHIHEDYESLGISEIEKLYEIYLSAIKGLVEMFDEN